MKFDKALSVVFAGGRAWIKPNRGDYIELQHNTIAKPNGDNYRPTVTELNAIDWEAKK